MPIVLGTEGELALSSRVEQTLGPQLVLELLKSELEGALALGFDDFGVELVFAAGFIDRDPAAADDLKTVLELEGDRAGVGPEHDGPELGLLVLEGEVEVARLMAVEVRDLPLDPEPGKEVLERGLDQARDLRD